MTHLVRRWLEVLLMRPCDFLGRRTSLDSTRAAVKGDSRMVHDCHVAHIDIRHVDHVNVGHGAVVKECSPAPLPAGEANAAITESVVDTAIETDVWPPVARVEYVN